MFSKNYESFWERNNTSIYLIDLCSMDGFHTEKKRSIQAKLKGWGPLKAEERPALYLKNGQII